MPETSHTVTLAPQGEVLEQRTVNGRVSELVPEVHCHQAVVLSY